MQHKAQISIEDRPDGPLVIIEYEDGHTVRIEVSSPDSPILRSHLGLDTSEH